MTTLSTKKPIQTLRDGSLKASIWGNRNENGVRYSVDLVRSYTDEAGNWHDSRSLSNGELLRGARLLQLAYDQVIELKAADRAAASGAQ